MPAGWTKFTNELNASPLFSALWYKVVTDADLAVSTYAITGTDGYGFIVAFAGVDRDSPIAPSTIQEAATASGTAHLVSGITTTLPYEMAVLLSGGDDNMTGTINNSFTEGYDSALSTYVGYREFAAPGSAVGNTTVTSSGSETRANWMFGLRTGKARRFYISTAAPSLSPSVDASWEAAGSNFIRRVGTDVKGSTALTTSGAVTATGGDETDTCSVQVLIGPLGTGRLSGPFKVQMQALESSGSANMRAQAHIRILKPDGTARATAYASDTTTNEQAQEFGTSLNTRSFPRWSKSRTFTAIDYQEGDFLCVELGSRKNTATTTFTQSCRVGENGTDLAETESSATDGAPWIEIIDGLMLSGEGPDILAPPAFAFKVA
jgi:hypothetical protein